jgi:hypothetical protein
MARHLFILSLSKRPRSFLSTEVIWRIEIMKIWIPHPSFFWPPFLPQLLHVCVQELNEPVPLDLMYKREWYRNIEIQVVWIANLFSCCKYLIFNIRCLIYTLFSSYVFSVTIKIIFQEVEASVDKEERTIDNVKEKEQ